MALQEESRKLQEKVQAAQEQLTPLQESVRDSFTQVAQVKSSSLVSCSMSAEKTFFGTYAADGNVIFHCNQQAAQLLPKRMNNSCSDYTEHISVWTDGATLLWLHQCVPNAVLSVYTGYRIHHICV